MLSGSMLMFSGSFFQLAKYIMARLEKQLIPWNGLEKALLTAPHIFQHYAVYLVANSIAGLVPDQLAPSQKDLLVSERALQDIVAFHFWHQSYCISV